MIVGLIDCDRKNVQKPFPNLPLMKISSYHKKCGDSVGWYVGQHCDVVYVAKEFSFSPDYSDPINADKVIRGGPDMQFPFLTGKKFTMQN